MFGRVVLALFLRRFDLDRNFLFTFHPNFFYFFLLPAIILEAGFSMDRPNFIRNLAPILWFAVVGTVVAAVIIAGGLYLVGMTAQCDRLLHFEFFDHHFRSSLCAARYIGMQGSDEEIKSYCWLFAVLLSAVDPVATLSVLGGSRFLGDEKLFSLVFGESILNDAVAIVLYKTVETRILTSTQSASSTLFGVSNDYSTIACVAPGHRM